MNYLKALLILFFMLPCVCYAQDWKEQYVTSTGDTLRPKMRIAVADRLPIHFIYPNGIQAQAAKVPAKLYLLTDMPGRSFPIARLSRIPEGEGYKYIAVIQINSADIMPGFTVDYFVDIEAALKRGEISLPK